MNKLMIGSAFAVLIGAVAPAVAQPAPPPPGVASGTTPPAMIRPGPNPQIHTRVMVMNNKVMNRAEVASHVQSMFARLDANRDGFITKDEVQAVQQQMMSMHAGMEQHMGGHGMGAQGMAGPGMAGPGMGAQGMQMPDRGAMFDRLDTNHDGSISRQEYMAGRAQIRQQRVIVMRDGKGAAGNPGMMQHMRGMKMRQMGMGRMGGFGGRMFDMADANRDGRVSLAEAQAAVLAQFDRADLNHDGQVTPDERRQAHAAMRGQRSAS